MKITDVVKNSTKTVKDFLASAPEDEVYTVQELAEKFNLAESTLKASRILEEYRTKVDDRNFFGSLWAIAILEKRLQGTNEN